MGFKKGVVEPMEKKNSLKRYSGKKRLGKSLDAGTNRIATDDREGPNGGNVRQKTNGRRGKGWGGETDGGGHRTCQERERLKRRLEGGLSSRGGNKKELLW